MRKLAALVLALCLVFGAMCAMAEDKQEVKVGNMLFHIPADAVSGGAPFTGPGLEGQIFMNEKFIIVLATLDLDTIEANVTADDGTFVRHRVTDATTGEVIESSTIAMTTMEWALQLFGLTDADTAFTITMSSNAYNPLGIEDKDKPNGEEQYRNYSDTAGFISTSRNGTGIFISTMLNQGATDADPYELGVEIASIITPADAAVQE